MNDKNGVSLSSIRKWILTKYPETKDKQKASFNSLTIKVRNQGSVVSREHLRLSEE